MTHHLSQNHTEYWKTVERVNVFGESYTVGFHWYETFPTSKRLRWPVKCARDDTLPWVCTRKELMRGELTEKEYPTPNTTGWEDGNIVWVKIGGSVGYSFTNPRQGWLPNGMEIKGE